MNSKIAVVISKGTNRGIIQIESGGKSLYLLTIEDLSYFKSGKTGDQMKTLVLKAFLFSFIGAFIRRNRIRPVIPVRTGTGWRAGFFIHRSFNAGGSVVGLIFIRRSLGVVGLILALQSSAQKLPYKFMRDDTLRGAQTPVRTCYDVTAYDLSIRVDVKKKFISGSSVILYRVVNDFDSMQIDLFSNMKIGKILFEGKELSYRRDNNSVFVQFPETQVKGKMEEITVTYSGSPIVTKNPPWDGGFIWKKDIKGRDWVGVVTEGTGASLWWPCKDQLADEPDSIRLHYTVPTGLTCVANGQLKDTINNQDGTTTWTWFVSYPINLYNVTLNLAHYVHFRDVYTSGTDQLPLDYYVLDYNEGGARLQFQQVKTMMACFEKYFGKYPFWRDGYKLVETSYWGMEHQSAISYGNDYVNNKEGFDYIIIHESAHEWWGNNVSASDYADLWIHEAFATYAEALFVECTKSYDDAVSYLKDQRWRIRDSFPIVGVPGINYDGSKNDADMYFKGTWMVHTFRSVMNNDSLFFKIIKGLQDEFELQSISTNDVIAYINRACEKDYSAFFKEYLYYPKPPLFEYKTKQRGKNTELTFRWKTGTSPFAMPVEVTTYYKYEFGDVTKRFERINANNDWQTITLTNFEEKNFDVNTDRFYVKKQLVR